MRIQSVSAKPAEAQPVPQEQTDDSNGVQLDEQKLEKVFIGSIDQGTTSTRFIIFNGIGEVSRREHVNRSLGADSVTACRTTPNGVYPALPAVWLARA
jgi:hypothetical protein